MFQQLSVSVRARAILRRGDEDTGEPAALAAVPGLRAWRELLDREEASHFRLSGSGSAWFGLFDAPELAQETLSRLEDRAARAGLGLRLATVTCAAGDRR